MQQAADGPAPLCAPLCCLLAVSLLHQVCLSLLGTWAGTPWDPRQSTLLQVLVSIQSMIFIEEPFFNEPGYEAMQGSAAGQLQSDAYSAAIRLGTLQFAILAVLREPKLAAGLEDVVALHFRAQRQSILQQCDEWQAMQGGAALAPCIAQIRAELEKL